MLSELPRKTVEPIALACGTAVRTLQEFLVTASRNHESARDGPQRHLAGVLGEVPDDPLGTIGVVDETSCPKKGDRTPGVRRQYLGCVGKVDDGIVTVRVGAARGRFRALLDAELYLPASWGCDRDRCQDAGIPDDVRYRPKWRMALDQLARPAGNGVRFDWLVFDEGYCAAVPFLTVLSLIGQKFVAEVPVSFAVRGRAGGVSRRADAVLSAAAATRGRPFRSKRATIEHAFRVAEGEAGLMRHEGRQYVGLVRHLIPSLVVLGFASVRTDRLRGGETRV